jgi:hypothetical protein
MEIKSSFYKEYVNTRCADIPTVALLEIVDELSANTKFYMSSDIDARTTEKLNAVIVDMLKNMRFRNLPLFLIGEAFTKGAMGDLGGTTKFTARNVCIWLNQMDERLKVIRTEQKTKEDNRLREAEERSFRHTRNSDNLFGQAYWLKIGWYCAGAIRGEDLDLYTLDAIVQKLREGHTQKTLKPSMIL